MIVAPATSAAGTCGTCSSLLAPGQRYCIVCGERRGELPFRVPERAEPAPPVTRRSFGAAAAVVLGCGVLIGATLGPAITPASLASTAGQLIVVATGGGTQPAAPAAQLARSSSLPALSAPIGDVAKPPPVVVDRGGGAAPPQPAPAAPAAPPPPAAAKPAPPAPAPLPAPAPDPDPTITGTVAHLSPDGKRYAIATKEGQLLVLHAGKPPVLGDNLKLTVRALDDGTFDERKAKSLGHGDTAKIAGTITFADATTGTYTLSARGVSMLVHMPPAHDPLAPPPQPPAVGLQTTVDVTLAPQLLETKRVDGDPLPGELDLTGIVRDPGPMPDPTKLIVSADDAGESPATLTLTVPPRVDVSKLTEPGTVISALVKREADGSFTLLSASAA